MTIDKLGKTVGDENTHEAWFMVETGAEDISAVWYCGEKRCETFVTMSEGMKAGA